MDFGGELCLPTLYDNATPSERSRKHVYLGHLLTQDGPSCGGAASVEMHRTTSVVVIGTVVSGLVYGCVAPVAVL